MPVALILAYLAMLPRLEAEERLGALDVAVSGNSASFEPDAVPKQIRALEQRASGGKRKQRAVKASPADLAAMGVGFSQLPDTATASTGAV